MEKKAIARKLLDRGMFVEEVAIITGLSPIDMDAITSTFYNRFE